MFTIEFYIDALCWIGGLIVLPMLGMITSLFWIRNRHTATFVHHALKIIIWMFMVAIMIWMVCFVERRF